MLGKNIQKYSPKDFGAYTFSMNPMVQSVESQELNKSTDTDALQTLPARPFSPEQIIEVMRTYPGKFCCLVPKFPSWPDNNTNTFVQILGFGF